MGMIFSAACCACNSCLTLASCCSCLSKCCCGGGSKENDSANMTNSGPTSGRKRSVALLIFSIALTLILQYGVAPQHSYDRLDYAYGTCDDGNYAGNEGSCRGISTALRTSFATVIFFLVCAVWAAFAPSSANVNGNYWGLKITIYIIFLVSSMFLPYDWFDRIDSETGGLSYLPFARIGAFIFLILQQIILIDLAYGWNDAWLANSEADEYGPSFWLRALVVASVGIFIVAFSALGLMFHYFKGCGTNDAFNIITCLLILFGLGAQLTGDEGSLLTTAIMSLYSVYLLYSANSSNPNSECNPVLGKNNVLSIILGVSFVFASMGWTCYSASKNMTMLLSDNNSAPAAREEAGSFGMALINDHSEAMEEGQQGKEAGTVKGVVTNSAQPTEGNTSSSAAAATNSKSGASYGSAAVVGEDGSSSRSGEEEGNGSAWKLNIVLACVSMWSVMVLTDWGTGAYGYEETDAGISGLQNPSAGKTAMWIMIVSQWIAMALYIWTVVAPRMFPDRDFS